MKYATVCSGVEAPTVAWHSLKFEPVWFSEIEPFPCKVLNYHYPQVPNLGDMTKLNEHETYRNTTINLLCGGTPCQSFSIAGLRGGLDDGRGNLALEYCRILIAKRPPWFLWENVPGVFSSNGGKDFACILSAFTGKEINPEGLGNAGVIEGEFYSVAWRVLDAQYFGVPQRRRRVFVVGYLGNNWRAPYAVLFERDSLRRDFTPGPGAREKVTGKINDNFTTAIGTITKQYAEQSGRDYESGLLVTTCAFNFDLYSGECKEFSPSLGKDRAEDTFIYDTTQITSPQNGSNPGPNLCHPLCKGQHVPLLTKKLARRLTPLECERLQGFPDNYTAIPGAKDGPRYAAIGNSMAVPVMKWIGERIQMVDNILNPA